MDLDSFPEGTFHVWQPEAVDLIKADTASPSAPWRIGGYASTSALDRQDETVYQKGLDFREFVQHGWFNDNHQQHTGAAVGIPDSADLKEKGWYVTGHLLKDLPRAQEIYALAKSLQGTHRRLGFSIEGKIIERVGNRISKALIRNVAVTNAPVNTTCTWDLLAKSWATDTEMKAMDVGYQHPPQTGAGVLVPESLEHGELRVVYECPTCKKAFANEGGLNAHLQRRHMVTAKSLPPTHIVREKRLLSRSEALELLARLKPEWAESGRAKVVDHFFQTQAVEA